MDFFVFLGFLSKLLRLQLKATKVATKQQKLPKMGESSLIGSLFARRVKKALAKGQSSPQYLEVGLRSGPYLLVCPNMTGFVLKLTGLVLNMTEIVLKMTGFEILFNHMGLAQPGLLVQF